jgi:hypothetical protein
MASDVEQDALSCAGKRAANCVTPEERAARLNGKQLFQHRMRTKSSMSECGPEYALTVTCKALLLK